MIADSVGKLNKIVPFASRKREKLLGNPDISRVQNGAATWHSKRGKTGHPFEE